MKRSAPILVIVLLVLLHVSQCRAEEASSQSGYEWAKEHLLSDETACYTGQIGSIIGSIVNKSPGISFTQECLQYIRSKGSDSRRDSFAVGRSRSEQEVRESERERREMKEDPPTREEFLAQ